MNIASFGHLSLNLSVRKLENSSYYLIPMSLERCLVK